MLELRVCGDCAHDGYVCEWCRGTTEDNELVCGLNGKTVPRDFPECSFHIQLREQREKNECLAYQLAEYKKLWWEAVTKFCPVQMASGPIEITKKGEEIVLELPKNFCIKGKGTK